LASWNPNQPVLCDSQPTIANSDMLLVGWFLNACVIPISAYPNSPYAAYSINFLNHPTAKQFLISERL